MVIDHFVGPIRVPGMPTGEVFIDANAVDVSQVVAMLQQHLRVDRAQLAYLGARLAELAAPPAAPYWSV